MPKAHALTQRKPTRMKTPSLLLLAAVLGSASLPVFSQSAPAPGSRLCTAGFNSDYGWFQPSGIAGAIAIPGLTQANCTPATGADLKISLGGLNLPLDIINGNAAVGVYTLANTPSIFEVMLLEPALCEDYYSGTGGSNQWKLKVRDINNDSMFDSNNGIKGVNSLQYNVATGLLTPNGNDKLRCYSGLAANADLTQTTGSGTSSDPDHIFSDSMETLVQEPDLQVSFLDMAGAPIKDTTQLPAIPDLIGQAENGEIQFKVEVTNIGNIAATNVRIRELSPTNDDLLAPAIVKIETCKPAASGGLDCGQSSGDRLVDDVLSLPPGPNNSRVYTLKRKSTGSDTSIQQAMALIQVAAFSDPADGETNHANNSRTLRVKITEQMQVTVNAKVNNNNPPTISDWITIGGLGTNCSTSGLTTTCPPSTSGLTANASISSGDYTFTGFTGSGCGDLSTATINDPPTSGSYTIPASVTSCNLTANFMPMSTVTVTHGSGGIASLVGSNPVHYGTSPAITVTPGTGYEVDVANTATSGTCVGFTGSGTSWQVGPVTASCDIKVKFKNILYSINTVVSGDSNGGSISGVNHQNLHYNDSIATASFTINVATGYGATISDTCGSNDSNIGTSTQLPNGLIIYSFDQNAKMTHNCEVRAEFALKKYLITSQVTGNGSIHFDESNTGINTLQVDHGTESIEFWLTPAVGHHVVGNPAGTSTCIGITPHGGATATGGTITGPIEDNGCEIAATFSINQYTVTINLDSNEDGTKGKISCPTSSSQGCTEVPDAQDPSLVRQIIFNNVDHGSNGLHFLITPEAGYYKWFTNNACNFQNGASTNYYSGPITNNCDATIEFLPTP